MRLLAPTAIKVVYTSHHKVPFPASCRFFRAQLLELGCSEVIAALAISQTRACIGDDAFQIREKSEMHFTQVKGFWNEYLV